MRFGGCPVGREGRRMRSEPGTCKADLRGGGRDGRFGGAGGRWGGRTVGRGGMEQNLSHSGKHVNGGGTAERIEKDEVRRGKERKEERWQYCWVCFVCVEVCKIRKMSSKVMQVLARGSFWAAGCCVKRGTQKSHAAAAGYPLVSNCFNFELKKNRVCNGFRRHTWPLPLRLTSAAPLLY